MIRKRIISFFVLILLCCGALFASSAAESAVQLKKITADVKEIVLYANQADPVVVHLAADPEDASLEGMALTVKKEGICTAELQGTEIRVLPVAAGKTALTVTVGKKKLDLPVKVLVPVTGLSLTAKGNSVAGGKVTYTAVIEPKNAANKQVEWSLEGDDGLITINGKGVLSIDSGCPRGTTYTVKCRALGTGIPVEAEISGYVALNLPQDVKAAFNHFKELPVPEPLRHLSLSGKGWIPSTEIPSLTGFEVLELTDNELYIKTERDITNIYIVEANRYDNPSQFYGDYNSQSDLKIRSRREARFRLHDPERHAVQVYVSEDVEMNGKKQNFTQGYKLKLNPLRLEASTSSVYRIVNLNDFPPYTAKTTSCHDYSADVYPDGSVSFVYYRFGSAAGELHFQGHFKENQTPSDIWLSRAILQEDVSADVWLTPKGEINMLTMEKMDLFFCRFKVTEVGQSRLASLRKQYPELENYNGPVHLWTVNLNTSGQLDQTLQFFTTGDLFTHEEDCTMVFHPEVTDLGGNPFPWRFLEELIGPNTFAYPFFTE